MMYDLCPTYVYANYVFNVDISVVFDTISSNVLSHEHSYLLNNWE